MNDKMKTAISIIAIACLCACTSTNEQTQIQTPRTEYTAPMPKNQNWGKVTDQEWKTIIQQLSDHELSFVYMGMETIVSLTSRKMGIDPFPRISPELSLAAKTHANDLLEAEWERRKSEPSDWTNIKREWKPLRLPRTAPPPTENITTSFPQRLFGQEPDNFTWRDWHTSQFLKKLSLNELKELRNEYQSKMTDEELLRTYMEIEKKEDTSLIAEQMLNNEKQKKRIEEWRKEK